MRNHKFRTRNGKHLDTVRFSGQRDCSCHRSMHIVNLTVTDKACCSSAKYASLCRRHVLSSLLERQPSDTVARALIYQRFSDRFENVKPVRRPAPDLKNWLIKLICRTINIYYLVRVLLWRAANFASKHSVCLKL